MENSIATVNIQNPDTGKSENELALSARQWSTEQDGPNDHSVDIWWRGKWIPAFFKDIKKGDFYMLLNANLEPDRCFLAGSDVKRFAPHKHLYHSRTQDPTFV